MSFGIDQLIETTARILKPDGTTAGSGFFIRPDGLLITCHHVIYGLDQLRVEYRGIKYDAEWRENLSRPEADIAILYVENIKEIKSAPIINPWKLTGPIIGYGFTSTKEKNFPEGFDFHAKDIYPSAPIKTLSIYPTDTLREIDKPWKKLPKKESSFHAYRIEKEMESGCSGGPVFAEDLGGVIGVLQSRNKEESYAIRWDNITKILDRLGLEPEKNAACAFLREIAERFQYMRLFPTKKQVIIEEQYIPIQVTELAKSPRLDSEGSLGYMESEEDLQRAYAFKGLAEAKESDLKSWEEIRQEHPRIMVLADPGMGKSALLCLEARLTALAQNNGLVNSDITPDEAIFPLWLRLDELAEKGQEIFHALPIIMQREHPLTWPPVAHMLEEKLRAGRCLLLLDGLDEVELEKRQELKRKLERFCGAYANCPIIATSRLMGYAGAFLPDSKEVEIVPFADWQVEEYIRIRFANLDSTLPNPQATESGLILDLRSKPQIRGLSQNPLLLSLLCSLYREGEVSLPTYRVQVYEKALNLLLGEWSHRRRGQLEGKKLAKLQLLEWLAYRFSYESKEIFSGRELFERIGEYLQSGGAPKVFQQTNEAELMWELSEEDGIIIRISLREE